MAGIVTGLAMVFGLNENTISTVAGAVRPVFDVEKEENIMTGKEIYDALQGYLAQQSAPTWEQADLEEAGRLGTTDGKNPMQLIPCYQAAIMAKRAAEK